MADVPGYGLVGVQSRQPGIVEQKIKFRLAPFQVVQDRLIQRHRVAIREFLAHLPRF